jgi:hypothetical protein
LYAPQDICCTYFHFSQDLDDEVVKNASFAHQIRWSPDAQGVGVTRRAGEAENYNLAKLSATPSFHLKFLSWTSLGHLKSDKYSGHRRLNSGYGSSPTFIFGVFKGGPRTVLDHINILEVIQNKEEKGVFRQLYLVRT